MLFTLAQKEVLPGVWARKWLASIRAVYLTATATKLFKCEAQLSERGFDGFSRWEAAQRLSGPA